jgi:hypothetical protein
MGGGTICAGIVKPEFAQEFPPINKLVAKYFSIQLESLVGP